MLKKVILTQNDNLVKKEEKKNVIEYKCKICNWMSSQFFEPKGNKRELKNVELRIKEKSRLNKKIRL